MLIQKAYRFKVCPNGAQVRAMRRTAGCRRWVMNKALEIQQANHAAGVKYIGYAALCKLLTTWRAAPETAWLQDAPSHTLQQALKDLDRAYQNFFGGRADFPTFKKKGQGDSFRYPDAKQFKVDQGNDRLFCPKLGWMRYRNSRQVQGQLRNLTIRAKGDQWFASIQTQFERTEPAPAATSAIGIDMGVKNFAALSNGQFLAPVDSFKRHEQRLAKYQRRMSRKTKFSNNWKKAKAKVTKVHVDIANVRNDYLHKASTTLSKSHALVALEDLKIGNMVKSAKGTAEQPGRNVKAKSGLNKAILDQGWGEFGRQLDYKLAWKGGWIIFVPAAYTSQTCPCCAHVDKNNRQTQSQFLCTVCWYENHADTVAAINVLDRATAILSSEAFNEGQDMAHACAGCESTARIACEVNGAARPSATGTHRSDLPMLPMQRQAP